MWLRERTEGQKPVSDIEIRTRAKEIAKIKGVGEDKFKASAGWVENFKHRNNIKKGVFQGVSMPDPESVPAPEHDSQPISAQRELFERSNFLQRGDQLAFGDRTGQQTALDIDIGASQASSSEASAGPDVSPIQGSQNGQQPSGRGSAFQYPMESVPPSHASDSIIPNQAAMQFQSGIRAMQLNQPENSAVWGALAHAPSNALNVRPTPNADVPTVTAREAFSAIEQVMRFLTTRPLNGLSEADNNLLTDLRHHIFAETARDDVNAATARAVAAVANQSTQAPVPPLLSVPAAITAGAPTAAS